MRKVALVFVLAVLVPSLLLAWLAVRSLRDQQFLIERQQSLLCQRVTDTLAQTISDHLAQQQQEFAAQVESLAISNNPDALAVGFDDQIRRAWPLAEVGFSVTLSGPVTCTLTSPTPAAGPAAQRFLTDNQLFLGNQQSAEVYWNANNLKSILYANVKNGGSSYSALNNLSSEQADQPVPQQNARNSWQNLAPTKAQSQSRAVDPQGGRYQNQAGDQVQQPESNLSKVVPAEAEFRQLIGDQTDGMIARFLQDKLKLMFWHRLNTDSNLVFGAELNLNHVIDGLRDLVQPDPELTNEIVVALLDDNARPVVLSCPNYHSNWKHPFVATEVGQALPHWEVAAYLMDPAALTRTACIVNAVLGVFIAVLVLAIVIGSWLIVRGLNTELTLARQKTDFVSNVSHELKTPLTSIRMFSELLADGRVTDAAKQKSYLQIISAEAARLTRLINNVLDFSRMERGEKKYDFKDCDLNEVVRAAVGTFRPHLEANGLEFVCDLPDTSIPVCGDADALSQVIVNLLSNAEKYSKGGREITLQLTQKSSPLPHAELKILDRGSGIPRGSEEKIFEKFYRAHDSLSSGIQGSGLGLTIARQIARAHGGDVIYEAREGGGSCFILRLPLSRC
ncbi:MAG TPA: HAMP domain-containing sensor histidine kinase [Candidatus Sulfotelmatobacter sp.]|jgi:signal transduction histidine kinase|nr:HAMP domain-containing sensor histidine kinase [Candidatus Sulfotelmatobacter sp.]